MKISIENVANEQKKISNGQISKKHLLMKIRGTEAKKL